MVSGAAACVSRAHGVGRSCMRESGAWCRAPSVGHLVSGTWCRAPAAPLPHKLLLSPSCAASCLISTSIYSDLFFFLLRISAACFEILTLMATVRPVAGRPDANLIPDFIFILFYK